MHRTLSSSAALLLITVAFGCSDGSHPAAPGAPPTAKRAAAGAASPAPTSHLLAGGFTELQGSAVGPGGALFVTAPLAGEIWRVDPGTGAATLFASGLPARDPDPFHLGSGVVDVAFLGGTAYALVTCVGPEFGCTDVLGIYRIDGPQDFTVIADLGAFSIANPPATPIFLTSGYQYAIEPFRGGFLVTDGHHNRVLHVELNGAITEIITFDNVAPTGLAVRGNSIYVAQAGPVPHAPADGRVVVYRAGASSGAMVAAGAPLLVDVERGRGRSLFALAQGIWDAVFDGEPALPNTGSLVQVADDGTFTTVAEGLDRPTSLEIIGNTAYVVTLGGEIWKIDGIAGPPFGR